MKQAYINAERQAEMARSLGCVFCEEGRYAEMSMPLAGYAGQTSPIEGVTFGFYHGSLDMLHEAVAKVDPEWVQYFTPDARVFCAWAEGELASFCMIDTDVQCLISRPGEVVASIGCVGTVPAMRRRGIGLRMVDLATVWAREQGCTLGYIHYTGVAHWYARLGYEVFARFSISGKS